jgi:3'-5' exoribonuclease
MKQQYVSGLQEGARVSSTFALRTRELRSTRSGEAYLTMEIADRTGRITAVMFRPDRQAESVPAGTVIHVDGTVTCYRGVLRVSATTLRVARTYEPEDLLPAGQRDTTEMIAELRSLIRVVKDPGLAALLKSVFGDRTFMRRFRRCPAAQAFHHAYLGGLMEHTISVARICRGLAALYPQTEGDLLVAGALLHDIGKVDELVWDTAIDFTDEGRLLGHVVLGERRVQRAVDAVGETLSRDLATRLSHIMVSHHGELEWGSPKRPSTLEALLLHHADNLDAKAAGFSEASHAAALVDEPWTDASNLFRRPLYAPRAVEDDREYPAVEEAQYLLRGA